MATIVSLHVRVVKSVLEIGVTASLYIPESTQLHPDTKRSSVLSSRRWQSEEFQDLS